MHFSLKQDGMFNKSKVNSLDGVTYAMLMQCIAEQPHIVSVFPHDVMIYYVHTKY